MSKETDQTGATAMVLPMHGRLVSSIDAMGDDAEASQHVSERLIEERENRAPV